MTEVRHCCVVFPNSSTTPRLLVSQLLDISSLSIGKEKSIYYDILFWQETASECNQLLLLFSAHASVGIDNLNVELAGALDNLLTLLGGDVVGNLGSVLAVVHEEEVQIINVVDTELKKSVGKKVSGLLVRSISDLGHGTVTLEPSADAAVNSLWLSQKSSISSDSYHYDHGPHSHQTQEMSL